MRKDYAYIRVHVISQNVTSALFECCWKILENRCNWLRERVTALRVRMRMAYVYNRYRARVAHSSHVTTMSAPIYSYS